MRSMARERRVPNESLKCTLYNMALVKEGVVLDGPHEMSDNSLLVDRIYLSSPPQRTIDPRRLVRRQRARTD